MPSIVWCDRARYIVEEDQKEVEDVCQTAMEEGRIFIYLQDARNEYKKKTDEEVCLKISKISAIEKR